MGQILHARATTTHRQRAFIQQSEESIVAIANRLGVNPKTVAKWRQRKFGWRLLEWSPKISLGGRKNL